MPKISVIVPVYNVEKFLERCVQSLRMQTLQDIEIILVDDQSPDNCPKICDEYEKKDERIKVIHKQNGGLGYARNSGMEVATGEYIAFVDSDDYVDLDMFETMYNVAKDNNVDFVRVDNYKELLGGEIINKSYISPMEEGYYNQTELRKQLLFPQLGMLPQEDGSKYVSCSVWRNIYRRELIERLNLRFVSERDLISEDMPFNLQFMMNAKSAYVINKKFYHYIVNDKSLTQTYKQDRFEKEVILYNELVHMAKTYEIYNECELRLSRHLLARARKCIKDEFVGNINKKDARNRVRNILETKEIRDVCKAYPFVSLPFKYKIYAYLVKYKSVKILKLLKKSI